MTSDAIAAAETTRSVPLSQAAYEAIKHKIVSLELAPGSVIDESALRKTLGLGRTPIREALQRLALEKLISIVPRRGTFVTNIGLTDLQRLFEARLVTEPMAARMACQRGSPEHWQAMRQALEGLEDAMAGNETLLQIDRACHEIMYDAADNSFLRDTLITHYALSLRLWYYALAQVGDMRADVSEHWRILEALQAGDADRAAMLMRGHIQGFQSKIRSVISGAPTPNGRHLP